jgi:hypothetical protein
MLHPGSRNREAWVYPDPVILEEIAIGKQEPYGQVVAQD